MPAKKIENCPWCGSSKVHVEGGLFYHTDAMFQVWCDAPDCGACGPMRIAKTEAIRAWNEFSILVSTLSALLVERSDEPDGQDGPEKSAAESQSARGGAEAFTLSAQDIREDLRGA